RQPGDAVRLAQGNERYRRRCAVPVPARPAVRKLTRAALLLDEAQSEAVAFADRLVASAILLFQAVGRRQCPDAGRMILGVVRVGVDLSASVELEAGLLYRGNGHVLANVTLRGLFFLRQVIATAMADDAE